MTDISTLLEIEEEKKERKKLEKKLLMKHQLKIKYKILEILGGFLNKNIINLKE